MGTPARWLLSRKDDITVPEEIIEEVTSSGPADAVSVAAGLPEPQRAILAQFCYGRRHLRHLGLLIAGTLSQQTLMQTFGGAWEVIQKQAQDPDKTLASEKRPASEQGKRSISLATVGQAPIQSREEDDDLDADEDFDRMDEA
ncbi:MAG: hypothetical protein HKN05_19720 [Rhizobiales bacterium]|nr:hypothetical protein [Hyphomicrobiales bacterium]